MHGLIFIFAQEMRPLLSILISVYFLFLAMLPCHCDLQLGQSCTHNDTEQVISTVTHHDDMDKDACTPFCSCSNFHNSNFVVEDNIDLPSVECIPAKKIAVYSENKTSSYLQHFWRPPQV